MNEKYAQWIADEGLLSYENTYGRCVQVTLKMQECFPELERVRGHYLDLVWGSWPHWWLVDPDGKIVDPTSVQFPTKGRGHYEPWKEGREEPTGKCPNCGEYAYKGETCCSDECYRDYHAYCMEGLMR